MRITGGTLTGRTIKAPSGRSTRPTSDRVRAAIFNILAHRDWGKEIGDLFDGTRVLDAFGGTGALAFEALSYGAEYAILFDQDRMALRVAEENAETLGVKKFTRILSVDALHPPHADKPCRLIFLDPPYRKNLVPQVLAALDKAGWIAPHALIVAETAKKEIFELPDGFAFLFSRFYGDTAVHFIKH